jgi:hypothetical protein
MDLGAVFFWLRLQSVPCLYIVNGNSSNTVTAVQLPEQVNCRGFLRATAKRTIGVQIHCPCMSCLIPPPHCHVCVYRLEKSILLPENRAWKLAVLWLCHFVVMMVSVLTEQVCTRYSTPCSVSISKHPIAHFTDEGAEEQRG